MGSIREYTTIRDYVSDCDGVNFDRFNDSKDSEYYLSVAHNALEEYTGYFGQGYVEYYEGNTDQVFVSDRISGGLILNSDEVVNDIVKIGLLVNKESATSPYALDRFHDSHDYSARIIDYINSLDKDRFDEVEVISLDDEKNGELIKQQRAARVSVFSKESTNSHAFYKQVFDTVKILGGDTKLYVIDPSKHAIYAESSKGKGLIFGLRRED